MGRLFIDYGLDKYEAFLQQHMIPEQGWILPWESIEALFMIWYTKRASHDSSYVPFAPYMIALLRDFFEDKGLYKKTLLFDAEMEDRCRRCRGERFLYQEVVVGYRLVFFNSWAPAICLRCHMRYGASIGSLQLQ